jgi:hypothetical protein
MEGLMLHAGTCGVCGQGLLGFYLLADGETIILICDDCETAWPSPADAQSGPDHALDEHLDPGVAGGRDATRDEIRAKGWEPYVAGEYPYAKTAKGFRAARH